MKRWSTLDPRVQDLENPCRRVVLGLTTVSTVSMYFETEPIHREGSRTNCDGSLSPDSHHTARNVNDALEFLGFRTFHWCLLGYTSFAIAADAAETMVLSFLGPTVVCQFDASPAQESVLTSIVFLGMLVGVYVLGMISDVYGRRKGFLVSALVLGVAGVASSFSPNFIVLALCRMLVGAGLGGVPIVITLFTEFVPPSRRGMLSLCMQSSWAIGTGAQALLAWTILGSFGWRWFLFISAVPLFVLTALYPWVPESPCWLLSKGKIKDAERVIMKVASYNGDHGARLNNVCFDSRQSKTLFQPDDSGSPSITMNGGGWHRIFDSIVHGANEVRSSISHITSGHLKGTSKILWFIWFANATLYYGLVLLTTTFGRQPKDEVKDLHECHDGEVIFDDSEYFAVFVTALSEAPGILAASVMIDTKGRIWCLRVGMFSCAVCVSLLPFGNHWVQLTLLFLARAAIEGTFCVLYVYTPELYPTEKRSMGLALCNGFARVGGFCAPFFTVYLAEKGKFVWSVVTLACICFISFGSCMFLTIETMGSDLSQTHEESRRRNDPDEGETIPLVINEQTLKNKC